MALCVPIWLGQRKKYHDCRGEEDFGHFVAESIASGIPAGYFENIEPKGPLASFDMTEAWVEHPYSEGVALIGHAPEGSFQ